MLNKILNIFPKNIYPLILVYDPDGLLEDDLFRKNLEDIGFSIISEPNSIRLRHKIEREIPFSIENPIIIQSNNPLNEIPYDIWEQSHKITLSLDFFFPNLSYEAVKLLNHKQIKDLNQVQQPDKKLGFKGSITFILYELFELDLKLAGKSDYLITWLCNFHIQSNQLSNVFLNFIVSELRKYPNYEKWPLDEIISNKDYFSSFLQDIWERFLQQKTKTKIEKSNFLFDIKIDESDLLQSQIGKLIENRIIHPVRIQGDMEVPFWMKPGIEIIKNNPDNKQFDLLITRIDSFDISRSENINWETWQHIAIEWSKISCLRFKPNGINTSNQIKIFNRKQEEINFAFRKWLEKNYTYYANRQLPDPHHLYHIPSYLAYERRKNTFHRIVLLILDGMSLASWNIIRTKWEKRNQEWNFDQKLLLAQIPTITSISRQALISGLRPTEFTNSIKDTHFEEKLWCSFWEKENIPGSNVIYDRLHNIDPKEILWIDKPRLEIVCLIINSLDEMIHKSIYGARSFYANLNLWINSDSNHIEMVIGKMLKKGFAVFITSDHGFIESKGFGSIRDEGLTVEGKAMRVRIYSDKNIANKYKEKWERTTLWYDDKLLPDNIYALMPNGNHAFVNNGEIVLAHGGISIEEVVVPLIHIWE